MKRILLDREYDSICPGDYLLIDNEVLLFEKAFSNQKMMICGSRLCDWSELFFSGRGILFEEAPSPIRDLEKSFPQFSKEVINSIHSHVGEKISLLRKPLTADSILGIIYPTSLWTTNPSIKHAAGFLLWLDENEPENDVYPLINIVCRNWKNQVDFGEYLYNVDDIGNARLILKNWMGIEPSSECEAFGEFPIKIPDRWEEIATNIYRKEIIHSNGQFIYEILNRVIPLQLKKLCINESVTFFEKNPKYLDSNLMEIITPYVSNETRYRLLKLINISFPNDIPNEPGNVIDWFKNEYIPYREWKLSNGEFYLDEKTISIGRNFAEWYLDFYPKALNAKKYISFYLSQSILSNKLDHVFLLCVLDGLHILDAQKIVFQICCHKGTHFAEVIKNELCFSPLPTITDFSKGALIHGAQPSLMKNLSSLGEDLSEVTSPLEKLESAKPRDVFIWKFQEPDHTYHTKNKNNTLMTDVDGQLNIMGEKIINIVERLGSEIPLRIIITTDHGRLLNFSTGDIKIPNGFEAHGRAAWGNIDLVFPKSGYVIDKDIVFISKDRFGLTHDAAIILSDHTYQDKRGRKRTEGYTHGGIFPEEVLIPWIVLERDITKPIIEVVITGESQANYPGKFTIEVINTSQVDIYIDKLEMDFSSEKRITQKISKVIDAFSNFIFDIDAPSWPSSEELMNGKVLVSINLPNNEKMILSPSMEKVQVNEIYSRPDVLEGLT